MANQEDWSKKSPEEIQNEALGQAAKGAIVWQAAKWISGLMVFIPVILIWVAFFLIGMKMKLFFTLSANARGILIFAVLVIPLLAAAFIRPVVKNWLDERMRK